MSISTLSLTAPQFTEDDIAKERARMSDDELYQAYLDVHGLDAIPRDPYFSNRTLNRYLTKLFPEAVAAIPDSEKEAYNRAVKEVPNFHSLPECNPLHFLRYEDWNLQAAALRLVRYWDYRVQIYGERAFLPLTFSGNGVLTAEEVEILRTSGCTYWLPRTATGRSVLYSRKQGMERYPNSGLLVLKFNYMLTSLALEDEEVQRVSVCIYACTYACIVPCLDAIYLIPMFHLV
jgi:hypothetical protein